MGRFRKTTKRKVPLINTAALPDLIFTLLFFFILTTNLRSVPLLTHVRLPDAEQLQKLKEKSGLIYLLVGKHSGESVVAQHPEQDSTFHPEHLFEIQLNSEIINLTDMPDKLQFIINGMTPEELEQTIVVLKMDKDTPMGLVNDIRQYLREAQLHTIHYMVEKSK